MSGAVENTYRRHLSRGWPALLGPAVEADGSGSFVLDDRGNEYLDCGSYAVFLLGRRHPPIVAAVQEQIATLPLGSGMLLTQQRADAAEALASIAPQGLDKVCFTNSGAEATELGMKIARLNGCSSFVAMEGAFHGMTLGAMSLAGNPLYVDCFGPLLPNVERVPFGALDALATCLERCDGRSCVVVEPIQGENGVNLPPAGYLQGVADLCRSYGSLFMCDEIQCGLGRAGSWWVSAADQCRPDVLLTGKVLSGGVVPAAAVVATAEVFQALDRDPMLHGSTFGGAPVQCAAVLATVNALKEFDIPSRAATLGRDLLARISACLAEVTEGMVMDIRGRGLMLAIEFVEPTTALKFFIEMFDNGVITAPCSMRPDVVRLFPSAFWGESEAVWLESALSRSAQTLRMGAT